MGGTIERSPNVVCDDDLVLIDGIGRGLEGTEFMQNIIDGNVHSSGSPILNAF